mgnify:CR=1 FL=1
MSEKQRHAAEDAREIWSILQTAKCMARYDKISHEILAELLVSIATGGEVIGGNNRGSDVRSPRFWLIEVKSRILGTDGPYPRVSWKQHNLDKADWFAAVRWHRDYALYDAVMLPKPSARELYEKKRQATGLAHVGWSDWASAPGGMNIREECENVRHGLR